MKIPENYLIKTTDDVNAGNREAQLYHIKYYLFEIKVSLETLMVFKLPL